MLRFIQCLETNEKYNKEYYQKICINSYAITNQKYPIEVYQPNNNNISENLIKYINKYGYFFKEILPDIDSKDYKNYFNKFIVMDFLSSKYKNDYLLWMDVDVVFLKEITENIFQEITQNNKCKIIKIDKKDFNKEYFIDIYDKYFKKIYKIDLEYFVPSSIILANSNHFIWKETYKIMLDLVNISKNISKNIEIPYSFSFEEMALTILANKYPNDFEDFNKNKKYICYQEKEIEPIEKYICNNDSILYHYNTLDMFTRCCKNISKKYFFGLSKSLDIDKIIFETKINIKDLE